MRRSQTMLFYLIHMFYLFSAVLFEVEKVSLLWGDVGGAGWGIHIKIK